MQIYFESVVLFLTHTRYNNYSFWVQKPHKVTHTRFACLNVTHTRFSFFLYILWFAINTQSLLMAMGKNNPNKGTLFRRIFYLHFYFQVSSVGEMPSANALCICLIHRYPCLIFLSLLSYVISTFFCQTVSLMLSSPDCRKGIALPPSSQMVVSHSFQSLVRQGG